MSITPQQRKALADKAGINEQYLYQCLVGRRDMRPSEAVRVVRLAGGLVTLNQLRRDWKEIWPDLKAPKPKKVEA